MSDKIDLEPVEKEKTSDVTPSDVAVSNGIEDSKEGEDLNKLVASSPPKEEGENSSNMTNKDIPVKPSQRSQRMRSRSKSSNSDDVKNDKSASKSTDESTAKPVEAETNNEEMDKTNNDETEVQAQPPKEPTKEETQPQLMEVAQSTEEAQSSETAQSINSKEKESETASSSETAMEVDEVTEKTEKTEESGPSEVTPTPKNVEDENSNDFIGFSTPEDKYSAFSVVFRPFEEKIEKIKNSRSRGQNGPLNPLAKLMPLSPRAGVKSSPSHRIDITDPEFRKPFTYGWRRELVFRSTSDSSMRRNADVYYYTPNNKKVRSLREVLEHLIPGHGLGAENFTFCKEPLGLDDPEKEIIREAKFKPSRPSDEGFYTLPVKKSTPKQKPAPKAREKKEVVKESIELSPSSSPGTSSSSPLTPRIVMKTNAGFKVNSKKMTLKVEKRRKAAGPDDSSPLDSVENDWSPEPKAQTNGLKRGGSDAGSGSDGSPPAKMSAVSPKSVPSVKQVGVPKPAPKVVPSPKQSGAKSPAQLNQVVPLPAPVVVPHPAISVGFMNFVNAGYIALLHAFQYLKVHELLRAACVNKMWSDIATHRSLWETVKMKNSRVRNWEGFGRSLRNNGTRCLDLKKMLVPDSSDAVQDMWNGLVKALRSVPSLVKLDVGRCTPDNLEIIAKACPQLESIVALSIRGHNLDLSIFKSENLVELRLKSVSGMELNNFSAMKELTNLKHLSLLSIKKLVGLENSLPKSLETLELGECCHMSEAFANETLPTLRNLTRLRLEKGQGSTCPTTQLITSVSQLENLSQLELINFDIKPGFDKALAKCVHIKTLLIIPTYVTQSATTNHVVMGGVTKLSASLEYFIWGLTLELLRVTDLFIDQVEGQKQKAQAKKGAGDSIPILKPLSDEASEPSREGQTTSQVDILALPKLQKVLSTLLPTTRVKILKVPFSATWRQTVD